MDIKKTRLINILSIFLLIFTMQQNLKASNIINNEDISININGIIKTQKIFKIDTNKNQENSLLLEIKAKSKEKENISTYGKLQEIINLNITNKENNSDYHKTKLAYIGIKHKKLGEIKLGKNYSVIYKTLSYTDISPYFRSKIFKQNSLTGINNNTVTYKKTFISNNKKKIFKKITFTGQYQGKNFILNKDIHSIKNGWGLGYNLSIYDGIKISSSYAHQNWIINKNNYYNQSSIKKDKNYSSAWSTSIKYNSKKLYIAYSYITGNNLNIIKTIKKINDDDYIYNKTANTSENINIIAKYNFNSGFTPILGYTQNTAKYFNKEINLQQNIDIEKYFNIGATFNFNKSLSGYFDYKINQLPKDNIQTDCNNNFTLGFVYKF